ncbi:hypothetical protein [Actinoplanes sp. DH11]|uniref:hypothetical protein n=1 Tax=Actinoplanes sp. DH11 TaxID=2857011 RepID=UPI001E4AF66A|nr:hypothetical protein [Actinoplanes sp. DH11]
MESGASITLNAPPATTLLDPLQVEGVASLLDRLLDQLEGAHNEDGDDEVVVVRYWIGAHPEGALVLLVLDADSLVIAEAAARDAMQQLLEHSEHLTDWLVDTCEVGFNQQFVDAGLQAADGPDVPPADPAERARWLAEQSQPPIAMAGVDAEIDWRKYVIDHASQLRAFDSDVFGLGDDEDTARLAAGALIFACTLVIDELFQDIATLAKSKASIADTDDVFMVLDDLPERFAQHYNGRFARQFLIAAVTITGRLTADGWAPPSCIAEALALHVVVENAKVLLDGHDLLDNDIVLDEIYNGFDDAAYEDLDHEWLYRRDLDGFEDDEDFTSYFGTGEMRVESWFEQ